MELTPIKTKKIYEEIVDQITGMIADNNLTPGDRLISERQLAEQLCVGRSAVREAIRTLEAMGIVEIRPGSGTFVREVNNRSLTNIISFTIASRKGTIKELLELRKILEVQIAGLAALRHTHQDKENLKNYIEQMQRYIDSAELSQKADVSFHYVIAQAARNSLVVRMLNSIWEAMDESVRENRRALYLTPGAPERLLKEHTLIYESIINGCDKDARRYMYEHLHRAEMAFLQYNGQPLTTIKAPDLLKT